MKTISVKLPEPVAAWLVRRAKETKRTRSAIVREALERQRSSKDHPKSCRDLLDDLHGYFDGPPDLSTNPKYLEGFGK
jgi:Arc/MetJ-type ribon-helix-helix transcriptional regulator